MLVALCKVLKTKGFYIDFSHQSNVATVLSFCVSNKKPLVLATTGLTQEDENKVLEASKVIPIFKSSNMSEGVFVLLNLIKSATKMLNGWDIEIIEKHHSAKKDSPSGTGLMMANQVTEIKKEADSPTNMPIQVSVIVGVLFCFKKE